MVETYTKKFKNGAEGGRKGSVYLRQEFQLCKEKRKFELVFLIKRGLVESIISEGITFKVMK